MSDLIAVQVKGNVGTIEDNLDAVEFSIREKTQEYLSVVLTEDTVKDGKKLLADIRKEKKTLDDERKAIKSRWMAPYDSFEKRAKQIIALYDEPVRAISSQIEEFEEQRRKEKRTLIKAVYDSVKGNLADYLPLNLIYIQKWENATCTENKIREDMQMVFDQMRLSVSTIKTMHPEFEEDALQVLKETGDLRMAVSRINDLQENKQRFLEQARKEAERERLEKEREEAGREEKAVELQDEAEISGNESQEKTEETGTMSADEIPVLEDPFTPEKVLTVMVKIGENDLDMLKDFLDMADLEYEVM